MESRDSVADFEWVCILTISVSYDFFGVGRHAV